MYIIFTFGEYSSFHIIFKYLMRLGLLYLAGSFFVLFCWNYLNESVLYKWKQNLNAYENLFTLVRSLVLFDFLRHNLWLCSWVFKDSVSNDSCRCCSCSSHLSCDFYLESEEAGNAQWSSVSINFYHFFRS